MSSVIDGVDQRTQLAGHNRLELLLFELEQGQTFGINVFKVKEAIPCPTLTQLPHAHPYIKGVAHIRGKTLSVLDLAHSIGLPPVTDTENSFIIITEYNRTVQGFLVANISRIINISWTDILPPPNHLGKDNFLTAITKLDDKIIEIIDVEKILADVTGSHDTVSQAVADSVTQAPHEQKPHILVADDSSVARKQIQSTLNQIGMDVTLVNDGKQALDQITQWQQQGLDIDQHIALLISDIEMPEMDGYSLTTAIRQELSLNELPILLHSSMSGAFNESLVENVGANQLLGKFNPDELAMTVQDLVKPWQQRVSS